MTKIVDYSTSLIPWASEVNYQGNEGSCGPNMAANAISLTSNLYGNPFEVNRQILYNMYLNNYHLLGTDAGVNPAYFAQTLSTLGVTQNTDMDYGISHISEMPSTADYTDAATHTLNLEKIRHDAYQENRLAHVLAEKVIEGKPLLLYMTAMGDFMSQSGPLSQQNGHDFSPQVGGHAVEITSVDTANNMLTVSSWGSQYGDHGYYHLSLDSFYSDKGGNPLSLWDIYQVNGFNGIDLTFNANTEQVGEAFVGLLSRAPANPGMANYVNMLNSGSTLENICDNILSTAEGQSVAGILNNTDYVQMLFHNVLGRDALSGGLSFYTGELANGATRGHVAAEIMVAGMDKAEWQDGMFFGDGTLPYHPANPDSNIYSESLVFQNKVIAAQDYAITLHAAGGHNDVASSVVAHVTDNPGSIWGVALVGVREQLGYAHVDGVVTT